MGGVRLHMFTRALADLLEPETMALPPQTLVRLCCHLGALEMFPMRLTSAMIPALQAALQDLSPLELVVLLRSMGRLRWRLPEVLGPMSARLQAEHLDTLDIPNLRILAYELYRLDL